ncbi:MAG: BMP family ABC transporter substrate-binding protein [Clostridiales bacterium]|nr:BMP family ABC transporter substrate-binding protein [Clostridiales bacterium]
MKKIIALLCVVAMIFVVAACNTQDKPPVEPIEGVYIALVTDVGNIDDESFNQGTWEGVVEFATKNNVRHDYFQPTEDSPAARVQTINEAIAAGATIVVTPGFLFEDVIYDVQLAHPTVKFLLLDGEPHTPDYATYFTADNTHNILYMEEQAGYLAGYAAVKEGFTKLGFLGGMAVPAVVRYGYGFVQGADAAAAELGNTADIELKYWYCGGFGPTPEIQTKMAGWYTEGTEVVFACGGAIYVSCLSAAQAAGAKVIGVDVDQASQGPEIITSAMKGLSASVVLSLTDLMNNGWEWPADYAGKTAVLGAAENAVGLPTVASSWRLNNFTVAEYEALFAKLVSGEIVVSNKIDAPPTVAIFVDYQG